MTRTSAPIAGSFCIFVALMALSACTEVAVDPTPAAAAGVPPQGTGGGGASSSGGAGGAAGASAMAGQGTAGSQIVGNGGTFTGGGFGGAAGAAGSATAGSGGAPPKGPSAGCNAEPSQDEPQKAVQHDLMVEAIADKYKPQYVPRKFYTNLPLDYDAKKPYPTVFYGQGCGQTGPESGPLNTGQFQTEVMYVQLIPASVTAETVVPEKGAPGCFQAGRQGLADSPDGPYFDMVLAEVAAKYCIDTSKLYVAGWSSGAWLSNYLACARGHVIRGIAAGSGGLQHDHGPCTGGAAVMLLPGDAESTQEDGFDIGAAPARDLFIAANGCSTTPTDMQLGNQTCQVYGGCASPVAWCPAGGGHGGPLQYIGPSGWAFWQGLE
jgi:poly(3-hydroxybutyrate) depolymerase